MTRPNPSLKPAPAAQRKALGRMWRIVLASGAFFAAGCATNPLLEPSPGVAELILRESPDTPARDRVGGIFIVDGHPVPKERRFGIWVAAGSHRIEYLCPGWMLIDGYPAVRHTFAPGRNYELVCGDGPPRIVQSGRPD